MPAGDPFCMRIARVWLAVWVAAAALGAQPAKPPARPKAPDSDERVEAAIRARFARSKIASNHFQVRVQGGVATLEGRTDTIQHKGTATRLAKSAGAVRVVNKIEVSQAARERAARNLSKGRRRAQVKRGEPRGAR